MGKGTDRPKCRLCGAGHWSHEPHEFGDETGGKPKVAPRTGREPGEAETRRPAETVRPRPPTSDEVERLKALLAEKSGKMVVLRDPDKHRAGQKKRQATYRAKKGGGDGER